MAEQDEQVKKNMLKGYRRGVWGGRFVTVRKPHWDLIQEWAKKSGMSQASFYRAALMRGALELAKGFGFADKYPDLD